ncbi:GNAT family N-acetyltransferase [Zobellia barbeyronii]|uniref:GNAT family N-acetyltransferase n=1 Tax=Zobellia barbeyronii TaxID=2748009 RepID=A0ABS5WF04_9FLAO|nr:GNAT family N-acetyltransferase [Zobellia barbeyronii]MBT2160732.1 GNAT family N-acetyltransferase [Zobellia barbeyronii]
MSIKIIPFKPAYAPIFKELNQNWIEQYFTVEPKDLYLLENCQEHIIDKGGYIFFAKKEDTITGCFALLPVSNTTFELGKMAVSTEFQGLKIGQKLLSFAIEFAKEKSWETLILYSSTKLDNALHIYKKFGFKEVPLEKNLDYTRSDIKMQLTL